MTTPFDEVYYMNGRASGVSNYENYRWMADETMSMVTHLKRYLELEEGDSVLDVGASRGYLVKGLRILGINAYGYDISEWAVANCDPDVKPYMSNHLNDSHYDVIVSKNTLEHVPELELASLMRRLLFAARRSMFILVPLAEATGGKYIHPKEENDKTHVIRWTMHDWLAFLEQCSRSFVVNGSYFYPGLKPGALEVPYGYGFFTLKRI